MGSFSYTCAISGFPIHSSDKVRFILLTQNPYNRSSDTGCYPNSKWCIRAFPVKAKYNDYGSIEDYTTNGLYSPEIKLILAGFQKDLVEKGLGDNSCHDLAINKTSNFEDLLDVLRENRVFVYKNGQKPWSAKQIKEINEKYPEDTSQAGVPSIKKLEAIVAAFTDKKYKDVVVDESETHYPQFRIRVNTFDDDTHVDILKDIQKAVAEEYAVMLASGSGNYADKGELVVRAKPGTTGGQVMSRDVGGNELAVGVAMVREDVWQAFLKNKIGLYDYKTHKENKVDLAFYKNRLNKEIAGIKEREATIKVLKDLPKTEQRDLDLFNALHPEISGNEESVFPKYQGDVLYNSLKDHFMSAVKNDLLTPKLIDNMAETAFVCDQLYTLRIQWKCSSSCGPQYSEWKDHVKWQKEMLAIAKKEYKQQKEDSND